MKFLIIGGSGNLSEPVVQSLLAKKHIVHCITRGLNSCIELKLESFGARFFHCQSINSTSPDFLKLLFSEYDFIIDFIAYNPTDIHCRIKLFYSIIVSCYIFISTTAFYTRSSSQSIPYSEDEVQVSDSWDYAINKYQAEQVLEKLTNSLPFKTLVIRLGHTLGSLIPVYLGNPGHAFIHHVSSGGLIPYVGDIDHPWSVGTASSLSHILASLPDSICFLPKHFVFHYSAIECTWKELYSALYSALSIGVPIYNVLTLEEATSIAPNWVPSVINHKMHSDLYNLSRMNQYFDLPPSESIQELVKQACLTTLSRPPENSYKSNLCRLQLLANANKSLSVLTKRSGIYDQI